MSLASGPAKLMVNPLSNVAIQPVLSGSSATNDEAAPGSSKCALQRPTWDIVSSTQAVVVDASAVEPLDVRCIISMRASGSRPARPAQRPAAESTLGTPRRLVYNTSSNLELRTMARTSE